MSNSMDITGRVAVVVGATSGLGRALAIGLAEHGAIVVPTGRRADRVAEVCGAIDSTGGTAMPHTVDVGDRNSIDALRDAVVERFGSVDILVNAAGITKKQPTTEITEDDWAGVMDTNLTGIMRSCQSFYDPLRASGRGRVINIASVGSYTAFHQVAAYCASKAAVVSLTRSLGCEWAADGPLVNAMAPGVFPTDLNRALLEGTERGRELKTRTPMGRFGKPEELVGLAVLLSSDASSFMTGECISVDGGFLASGVNS